MSDDKSSKLVRMANQIADNFRMMPEKESVSGAADHLRLYWTPKMLDELMAYASAGHSGLNPLATRALAALREGKR